VRSISAALLDHYQQEVTTTTGCWHIKRKDGTEFYFTEHPEDLEIDGNAYLAASGFDRTAHQQTSTLSVNNIDIKGFLDNNQITEEDLRNRLFYDAEIWHFKVNYEDLTQGKVYLDYGYLGEVTADDQMFTIEFRSLSQRLDQEIGARYSRYCRNALGDSMCGVDLDGTTWTPDTEVKVGDIIKPTVYDGLYYQVLEAGRTHPTTEPEWDFNGVGVGLNAYEDNGEVLYISIDARKKTAVVDSAPNNRRVVLTYDAFAPAYADGEFKNGFIEFTSGANTGGVFDVKQSLADGSIKTYVPIPYTVNPGDTCIVTTGCNHILKAADGSYTGDCKAKFDNAVNFGGEPEIPGNNRIMAGRFDK